MRKADQDVHGLDSPAVAIQRQLRRIGDDRAALHTIAGQELESAATDARCQQQAGLFDAVAAAQREAEPTVLREANAEAELARLRKARQSATARATPPTPEPTRTR
ncbi:hypothetical protein [Streptomyces sp. NPDC048277]|uniref:hypothetical protein n=1 Tax=Streptomyces sp. NPDC048277 TaxID=3155027 RepID=UPI0033FC69AB